MILTRRRFLGALAGGAAGIPFVLWGQGASTGFAGMNEGAHRPVRLPAKGSGPSMTVAERDELEHRIRCQCSCTLDVYTCRTTDFSCGVSPAMHRDVMALVEGGHTAQDILDAFVGVYGEKALMAPKKTGFNWAAYIVPFAALGSGAALVAALIRKWGRVAPEPAAVTALPVEATPEELSRLDSAVRNDAP